MKKTKIKKPKGTRSVRFQDETVFVVFELMKSSKFKPSYNAMIEYLVENNPEFIEMAAKVSQDKKTAKTVKK